LDINNKICGSFVCLVGCEQERIPETRLATLVQPAWRSMGLDVRNVHVGFIP
jgi:hypothetical protein